MFQTKPCQSGKKWTWNKVSFSLWQWQDYTNSNEVSCILMVEAQNERLLLTGDISAKTENAWLKANPQTSITWLLAPHHGSNTASSQPLLDTTKPKHVIISRGWLNRFNHPHPQVLKRYTKVASHLLDTAKIGAMQIQLGQFLPAIETRREKKFWRKSAIEW